MKYKLTDETITLENGIVLHRIEYLKTFANIKAGDKGGWIEKEDNLSHEGEARVCGEARVFGNAQVCGEARVYGEARVFGNAQVYNCALVYGEAMVYGEARVHGNAQVYGNAHICDWAEVYGNARVYGNAHIRDWVEVYSDVWVYEKALVCGTSRIWGRAQIGGDAKILYDDSYIVFKNNWSSGRYFTWTRSNDMWRVGCFYGTGKELIAKAYRDSKLSGDCYKAYVELVEKLKQIKNE